MCIMRSIPACAHVRGIRGHESQLLVLQRVKINTNERELANKVEQEKNIMRAMVHMPDEPTDDADQEGKIADPGLRPRYVCAVHWPQFCHLASACLARL